MNTLRFQFTPYDLPLPRPIVTAHGTYARRQGVICKLSDADGITGFGDAAPLPGFSRESYDDTLGVIRQLAKDMPERVACAVPESIDQLPEMMRVFDESSARFPALRFALESALADLSARRAALPLARWMSKTTVVSVPINALIDGSASDDLVEKAQARYATGFRTFKIKVGGGSLDADVARVVSVRRAVPDAAIRIDANAGWSEPDAREILGSLRHCNLEFVEQPLPLGNISASRRIASDCGIALALDEEIETVADALALIEERCCDVLVLKPMVLGSLVGCLQIAQAAAAQNMKVVFTSAWESDIGLAATLHLVAATGATSAAGLATAGMIADGLVDCPLCIKDGQLSIHQKSGIGLSMLEAIPWEPGEPATR
jgi:o-succinylbenzoate synthase